MDFELARFNMIEQQIRPWNVLDTDVLALLSVVKRENFVPESYRALAFADIEVPLKRGGEAAGKSMAMPKFEARILQEVALKGHENVLEIGAGSGYMAALLANRARHVTTVEIDPELARMARDNLAANGVANVEVVEGDGARGWTQGGPFDVIVISGALPFLPEAFLQSLNVGGRLAAVIGEAPVMSAQLTSRGSATEFRTVNLFETLIEPLQNAEQPPRFRF